MPLSYSTPRPGLKAEKQHEGFVKGIENFDKHGLSAAKTEEKNALPDKESMFTFCSPSDGGGVCISGICGDTFIVEHFLV